jgi:hypothetical protein
MKTAIIIEGIVASKQVTNNIAADIFYQQNIKIWQMI